MPDNVNLLRLPSYAPELNPFETVWAYLRGKMLSMRLWNTYEEIVDDCCKAGTPSSRTLSRSFGIRAELALLKCGVITARQCSLKIAKIVRK